MAELALVAAVDDVNAAVAELALVVAAAYGPVAEVSGGPECCGG